MRKEIQEYLAAKAAEQQANEARIAAEQRLLMLLDELPDEGSKSLVVDGYKITASQRISRKLDEKAYTLIKDEIPEGLSPVVVVETYKVEDKGCRWLKDNEPGLWALLSRAITEKPMKIGVKVDEVKA
jgi:hypothetical protein